MISLRIPVALRMPRCITCRASCAARVTDARRKQEDSLSQAQPLVRENHSRHQGKTSHFLEEYVSSCRAKTVMDALSFALEISFSRGSRER